MDVDAEIRECNEQCQACMDDFQKDGLRFSPELCRYCQNGARLHQLLVKSGGAEAEWSRLDWNSCKYEKYYNG